MMAISPPLRADTARSAAIHPVSTPGDMRRWLAQVPVTRDFPPDLAVTLEGQAQLYVIEMSTGPQCLPCADMWLRLGVLRRSYRIPIRTIGYQEALLRSGRLGIPWVGHPTVWLRPRDDERRIIPLAIGTDHTANLARNAYLAVKMLTGVRVAVGLRGMAKYTGIVGASPATMPHRKGG